MLRTTSVDPTTTSLVAIGEDGTINRVDNSEVKRANFDTKTAKSKSQDKHKSKNLVKSFLAKF